MLKLLIVEDELLVRKGLITAIDWNSLGFEVIGDAADGQEALDIARKMHPDIVLTDVRMPKMDGIELIKVLRNEFPSTKVVVLSCYDDFEYVKEAMRLGAVDYILKLSMQLDDLIKVMENVKKMIEEEKIEHYKSMKLYWQFNTNMYELRSKFFNDIINGCALPMTWWSETFSLLNLHLESAPYIVACMRIDDYGIVRQQNIMGDEGLLRFSILNITDEIIDNNKINADIFHRKDDEFGIIFSLNNCDITNEIENLCKELLQAFKLYLNISVSFGISEIFESLTDLRENYIYALQAVNFRWYSGKGSINYYYNVPTYIDRCYYTKEYEMRIRDNLIMGLIDDAKNMVMQILESIAMDKILSPYNAFKECVEIVYTFANVVKQYGGNLNDIKDEKQNVLYDTINYCETLEDMKNWFNKFMIYYAKYLKKLKNQQYRREISKAIDYINVHYMEDIKLPDLAKYVGMDSAYFSFLFKKETGNNLTDYINRVRIEKAKEYLSFSDINIYEVAEKVGYANVSYFSKVFKQLVGMSPTKFKNILKNSKNTSKGNNNIVNQGSDGMSKGKKYF